MSIGTWIAWYGKLATLLSPVLARASVGAAWGLWKKTYPGEFVSPLATTVATPAAVFRTLVTTELDDVLLWQVLVAGLAGPVSNAVLAATSMRSAWEDRV